jgi:hypothetical protein
MFDKVGWDKDIVTNLANGSTPDSVETSDNPQIQDLARVVGRKKRRAQAKAVFKFTIVIKHIPLVSLYSLSTASFRHQLETPGLQLGLSSFWAWLVNVLGQVHGRSVCG